MTLPRINDRQIAAFRATVTQGTVTAAAAALHVAQPAISRLIQALESELGFALFERRGRGLQITRQGRLLFEEVERSYMGIRAIQDRAVAIRAGNFGRLSVAAMPAYADAFVAPAVGALLAASPEISVDFDVLNTTDIVEGVVRGRIDVGVSAPIVDHPNVSWEVVRSSQMVAVMRRDHPLARGGAVKAKQLAACEVITLPGSSPYEVQLRMAVWKETKRTLNVRTVVRTQTGACTAIIHGAPAIAVVDPCIASAFKSQLTVKPLAFDLHSDLAVCLPKGEKLANVRQFRSFLLERIKIFESDSRRRAGR